MRSELNTEQTQWKDKFSWQNIKLNFRNVIIYGFGERLIWQLEKLIPRYSLIGDTPFFERQQFDWVPELESNWQAVRKELDEILKYTNKLPNFQDISPDQASCLYESSNNIHFPSSQCRVSSPTRMRHFSFGSGIFTPKRQRTTPL